MHSLVRTRASLPSNRAIVTSTTEFSFKVSIEESWSVEELSSWSMELRFTQYCKAVRLCGQIVYCLFYMAMGGQSKKKLKGCFSSVVGILMYSQKLSIFIILFYI